MGSILPIRISMIKKFESSMGKFIWAYSGKMLRVPIDEIKNDQEHGGLNLPCLSSMCDALLTSQVVRLLRSGDSKSIGHMDFWVGELLDDLIPGMGGGVHAHDVPEYFDHIGELLASGMASELITPATLNSLTNKAVYAELTSSFPTPKVERESLISYQPIWKKLTCPVLTSEARDILFLLIHNKLPLQERLFRVGLSVDPYCVTCPGGQYGDVEHFFCGCSKVAQVWSWTRARVLDLLGGNSAQMSNWEIINLIFPKTSRENETIWLVGTYVAKIWEEISVRKCEKMKWEKFFGFLKFKFKADQVNSGIKLRPIPGI